MMKPCGNTGPTVPGWIRERIRRHEAAWIQGLLAAGAAVALTAGAAAGIWICAAEPIVYYARP